MWVGRQWIRHLKKSWFFHLEYWKFLISHTGDEIENWGVCSGIGGWTRGFDECGRSVLRFLADIYRRMETYNSRDIQDCLASSRFFFLSRDHWPESNARADNTPHPCHGSITSRNDVEIGLYSCHKSAAALLLCPCAAAIHTLHRAESECDVSFRC